MYGGLCTPPYLGTPKHNAVVLLIYIRLFLHCNFAIYSGIFRYSLHFCSDVNGGYNCKNITICKFEITFCIFHPRLPGSLRPTFSPSIQ